ncbi:MAG TPA: ABC transporter ATP-binding protein [Anaerolineales bacterium]|nr:ABC transporter ATP-binding protein [Anaerolineales bacterium]
MNLVVDGIHYRYPSGTSALEDVSLQASAGESVAVVGQNGAGKTTFAKHLNGLLKPTRGSVRAGDWDTRRHSPAQMSARVGMVFQNPGDQLFARTVWEEVAFGPRNQHLGKDAITERVESSLEAVGLLAVREGHPYDLATPQRKLVALAATLAMATPILVLDEPSLGQDTEGVSLLGALIDGLVAEGRLVLTITHDLDFALEHCPRAILMAEGRVLADGKSAEILSQSKLLSSADLEPPVLLQLAAGLEMPARIRRISEFVAAYAERPPQV